MMQVETNVKVSSILIAAIGGQGGNVLAEWLFLAASLAEPKMKAEAIALPGLSQRGGGTTFYLEIAHSAKNPEELERVVFSQHPFPGKVDIIIGQELVELGRVLRSGYASPQSTVVASTYRNYTIGEKMPSYDGVFPSEELQRMATSLAGQVALLDVPSLAEANGLGELATNAILLGVLSALPNALPFEAEACTKAIKQFGLVIDMNLRAFDVGRAYQLEMQKYHDVNRQGFVEENTIPDTILGFVGGRSTPDSLKSETEFPTTIGNGKANGKKTIIPLTRKPAKVVPDLTKIIAQHEEALKPKYQTAFRKLVEQVKQEFDPTLHHILVEAVYQTCDYQNPKYAARFVNLVRPIYKLDSTEQQFKLTQTFAKRLSARMTYEDAVRVASQKIKPERFARIRKDMNVQAKQVLQVTDYLKPDAAEIYGMLPYGLVMPLLMVIKGLGLGKALEKFYLEQKPRTNSFRGFLTFKFLTWFEPLRPISYRAHHEWKELNRYIRLVQDYATKDYELGLVAAESGKLVKGYGHTRQKMFTATDSYLNNVLAPLVKWEAKVTTKIVNASRYPVTVKTARHALSLLARDDDGIVRAESLAKQVLTASMPPAKILDELEVWAKALR